MSNNDQKKQEEIKRLKEEIWHLDEYLLSDCCRQCAYIVETIESLKKEIEKIISNHH